MKHIYHIATHTTNIGDGALVSGIQKTIREDWQQPIEFTNDCLMKYENFWGNKTYDRDLIEKINNQADLLIIGGGGMIDGSKSHTDAGMAFNLPFDLFKEIRVPVAFYAVGHNLFDKQIFWHKTQLQRLQNYVAQQPDQIFSVRNDGSLARLRRDLCEAANSVIEVPDPGMFIETTNTEHPEFLDDKANVLLQLAGDNALARFGLGYWKFFPPLASRVLKKRQKQQFQNLAAGLKTVSNERLVNYVLCPHLVRDYTINGHFCDNIDKGFARFSFNSVGVQRGTNAAKHFFDGYKKADMVIGMRGHSVICGVGLNTPTIALTSHDKIKGFMNTLGLSDRVVDINDPNLSQTLSEKIALLLDAQEEERKKLLQISSQCRAAFKEFNLSVLRLLK